MLYTSVLGRSCKYRLALAITLAALSVAFAPNAKAQITWTITVGVPASGTTLTYNLSCVPTPCPSNDPTALTVNRIDSVYWQTGAASIEMWIVHDNAIVDDNTSHKPTHHHHAKNGQDGGKIDINAPVSPVPNKYSIFVYDGNTKILYYDDPTIIIGGSGLEQALSSIENKCISLRDELKNGSEAEKARALCQQIKELEESLDSKKTK